METWTAESWIVNLSSLTSAAAIVITAMVALRTLNAHKRDSEATSRPMMMANLEPDPLEGRIAHLVIANLGRGIAKDVSVTFDPKTIHIATQIRARERAAQLLSRYEHPVSTWPPHYVQRNVYAHWGDGVNLLGLSPRVNVTITYDSDSGKSYAEHFTLDIDHVRFATSVRPSGGSWKALVTRGVSALESTARAVGRF